MFWVGEQFKDCLFQSALRFAKRPFLGLALAISVLLLLASRAQAENWCADVVKVREQLEKALDDSAKIEVFRQCVDPVSPEGDRPAIPTLIAALKEPEWYIRVKAAEALGIVSAKTSAAVPALIVALKDENAEVRVSVAGALEEIGDEAQAAVPALIAALQDPASNFGRQAAAALIDIGPDPKTAVPALIVAFQDKNSEVRENATRVLANMGPDAKAAIPTLIVALQDEDSEMRENATRVLARMGPAAKAAVPDLIAALQDPHTGIRRRAVDVLGNIGPDARAAVPALIVALQDKDSVFCGGAAFALERIGPDAKAAVPALIAILKDKDSRFRDNATRALGGIGPDAKAAVPALIAILKDKDSGIRDSAAEALGGIGADARGAVPALIATLKDKDSHFHGRAARALSLIATDLYYKTARDPAQVRKTAQIAVRIQQALEDADVGDQGQEFEFIVNDLKTTQLAMPMFWVSRAVTLLSYHVLIWAALFFVYPLSAPIRELFFWSPRFRVIAGLGYIDVLLVWIPVLRRRLFVPFKASLLAAANLDGFEAQCYFTGSTVRLPATDETQPLQEAIPEIKGRIVLEGASGLGKSMFLRHLATCSLAKISPWKNCILVYLNASQCSEGVLEAIQTQLPVVANDLVFLRELIRKGAVDLCIDGLDQASADTQAKITRFVERDFKGNIILTTQPLEWTPPKKTKTYVLQPLNRGQIEQFLLSRQPPASAAVTGKDYAQACRDYLSQALDNRRSPVELQWVQQVLSHPMHLVGVAQRLAAGETPDLLNLKLQPIDPTPAKI